MIERYEVLESKYHLMKHWEFANPGVPFERAFATWPLMESRDALNSAINWSWIQWHSDPNFERIGSELATFALRSAQGSAKYTKRVGQEFRGMQDWMVTACAILSGDVATMRAATDGIPGAKKRVRRNQYYEALAGILKCRIHGRANLEQEQLDKLQLGQPDPEFISPSQKLIQAFSKRDYCAFEEALEDGMRKHLEGRFNKRARGAPLPVVAHEGGRNVVNLRNKDSYTLWPYPEAVFAKLAALDGATIKCDSFWFPRDFVTATTVVHEDAMLRLAALDNADEKPGADSAWAAIFLKPRKKE
jgi:hypothetical protein